MYITTGWTYPGGWDVFRIFFRHETTAASYFYLIASLCGALFLSIFLETPHTLFIAF
jgi:hypothetical protein